MAAKEMAGKVVLVTGATSGLGKETATALAQKGAVVVVHGRSKEKAEAVAAEIRSKVPGAQIEIILADYSKLADVRAMADEFKRRFSRLDVLVNNAGIMINKKHISADGHELMYQVNFLAPFLLTCRLLDLIERSTPSRIVNLSSAAHTTGRLDFDDIELAKGFGGLRAYGDSKLMVLVFTYELARRLEGKGVTANAVHPGFVRTNLGSGASALWRYGFAFFALFGKNVKRGAETSIYLASSPEVSGITGKYFSNKKPVNSSARSLDQASWARLWET
ncbi:MAG: SDR family oxidoreductase, partial [Methanomassiliicoccales archaeon]|nr:SDR family oxidoreductase [Methanomassiliicoccales archaeon]